MTKEEIVINRYSFFPASEDANEIRKLLINEIKNYDEHGFAEYLRILCFMLFYLGDVRDCELIWRAKMLSLETGLMVDAGLLCGAGYHETLKYIEKKPQIANMGAYLNICFISKDQYDRKKIINKFKRYYSV